jgi:hypothetical protein
MLTMLARVAAPVGLFISLSAAPAFAGEAGGVAAQSVIQSQLEAFQRGDAEGAFALASPDLKATYSTSGNFMESIRSGNTPFFSRCITEFDDFVVDGDAAAQNVTVIDDGNSVWNVIYKLARQPDGTWLIDGVLLIKSGAIDT